MKDIIAILEKELYQQFSKESSGHDFSHLKRVHNLACGLQTVEGGDLYVVAHSALLHDLHRKMENEKGEYCTPKESLPRIEQLLNKVGTDKSKIPHILHCIEFHEEYTFSGKGIMVTDIETLILQDADNLDAIGAIGVGRAFAYGGAHGMPLWLPEVPFSTEKYDEAKQGISTIHHFNDKLLRLEANMNTETGKRRAKQRQEFMQLFYQTFMEEWEGER